MPALYWLIWLGGFALIAMTDDSTRTKLVVAGLWFWQGPEVTRYLMAIVAIVTGG